MLSSTLKMHDAPLHPGAQTSQHQLCLCNGFSIGSHGAVAPRTALCQNRHHRRGRERNGVQSHGHVLRDSAALLSHVFSITLFIVLVSPLAACRVTKRFPPSAIEGRGFNFAVVHS